MFVDFTSWWTQIPRPRSVSAIPVIFSHHQAPGRGASIWTLHPRLRLEHSISCRAAAKMNKNHHSHHKVQQFLGNWMQVSHWPMIDRLWSGIFSLQDYKSEKVDFKQKVYFLFGAILGGSQNVCSSSILGTSINMQNYYIK